MSLVAVTAPNTSTTFGNSSFKNHAMTKRSYLALLILLPCIPIYFACTKNIDCTTCRTNNLHPIANAGSDTIVWLPGESATLDGSNSTDPDNNIMSYYWRNISGPSLPQISNTNA